MSLLAVLLLAKGLTLTRYDLPPSAWVLPALLWQDFLVVLLYALVDRGTRRYPWIGWGVYGGLVFYAGVNVPIAKLFATPLTWPMLRATRGTLADSISHHVMWATLLPVVLVVVAGSVLPLILRRLQPQLSPRARVAFFAVAALVIALGPAATAHVELLAAHGNAVFILVTSGLPRVKAEEAHGEWRVSPFGSGRAENLLRFRGSAAGRNLVMIHLESTGAQYLRPYGAAEDPMPVLSALSHHSILFENAYAVYPETIKSFFAVHCSFYPALDTQAEAYEHVASPALARQLALQGYQTGLFHSGRFMYLGMESAIRNRGFETMEDAGDIGGNRRSSFGIDEAATVRRILSWLDTLSKDRPFFLTYLPIAGHHPYETPAGGPFPEQREIDRYRNALHDADTALAELLRGLEARGLDRNTLFVIFGDHGEAFDQHQGNFGHTMFLYEENVRIPYLIVAPGLIEEPIRITRVASQIDTAPTVLDLMGLSRPEAYQGRSLLDPGVAMALFCTDYSQGFLGLRDERWKLIHDLDSGRSKLFNIQADPDEKVDLAEQFVERVTAYRTHLLRWSAAQKFLVVRPDSVAKSRDAGG
jgi:arylsulfatase A-like enzyme